MSFQRMDSTRHAYWSKAGHPLLDTWTSRGPSDISGRLMGIVIDPRNNQKVFVASAGGGLWRTTDYGAHWSPVNDRWKSLAMGAVVMDPSAPDTMYAGTGEGAFNGDAIDGVGIYKSTDGGNNWTLLPNTTTFVTTNALAVSPANGQIVLAGTREGGIQRSTDGGTTWSNVKNDLGCMDIHFSNSNPNNVIAEMWSTGYYHYPVYSTDAGATWTAATGLTATNFYGRISLAYSQSNNSIVYAYVGSYQGTGNSDSSGNYGDIYKSTDGGHSYSLISSPSGNGQSWYTLPIWVDPMSSNNLIIGGLNCKRSFDGGVTWYTISDWTTNFPHADQHFIISDPGFNGSTNKKLYVATDGGLFRTDDVYNVVSSSGWSRMTANQASTQYYSAQGDGNKGWIIGGLQDNGSVYSNTASTLTSNQYGGDGGFCAMDPTDPNYTYGEYVYLTIHRASANGAGAGDITTGLSDAFNSNTTNFIAPFILSPTDPNTMWAGGGDLWRSTNVKTSATWTSVRPNNGSPIAAIAQSASNPNVVYVGCNDGTIQKTTNALAATPTWTDIDNNGSANPLPNRYCGRIMIDKDNENIVYAAFGGYNSDNLWKSTDGGATWNTLTGSGVTALPAAPLHCIVRHPSVPNYLYVASEVGVFSSHDGGATWSGSDYGPANVCTYELSFLNNSPNVLLAATHGRGLWTALVGGGLGVSGVTLTPSTVVAGTSVQGTVTLTAAAPAGGATVSLSSDQSSVVVPASVTVLAGQTTANFSVTTKGVDASTTAHVSANAGGIAANASLVVNPATFNSFALTANSVEGGLNSTGLLRLNGVAGPSGITVSVSSSDPAAVVPGTVVIGANTTGKSFTITTQGVDVLTQATVSAKVGSGSALTQVLTLTVGTIKSLVPNPATIAGGSRVGWTLTLNGRAGPSGKPVSFTDSLGTSGMPRAVRVPAGSHSMTFTTLTTTVTSSSTTTVTGITGAVTQSAQLTVTPCTVSTLTILPSATVVGGHSVTGVVRLNGAAPAGGLVVVVGSNSGNVTTPGTVTIGAGLSAASYTIQTKGVDADISVNCSASGGGTTANATLIVQSADISFVLRNPASVVGGVNSVGTIELDGAAGPSGIDVALGSTNTAAHVPVKVHIAPQATASPNFAITTDGVDANVVGNITGKIGVNATVNGKFTVTPAAVLSFTTIPTTSIKGGTATTGVVRLNGKAGPSGAVITLSGGGTNVTMPASVVIAPGLTAASFTIRSSAVTSNTNVTLTASYKGTATTTLTLTP